MAHKIIMLGGRRAGKSSILAVMLNALREMPGDLCTITDLTDYDVKVVDKNGIEHDKPTLRTKCLEIKSYLQKRTLIGTNTKFIVDMNRSETAIRYSLQASIGGTAKTTFEFIDVPGEWMRQNVPEHAELKKIIEESDVYIIAIDTPFLMEADEDVNSVYNRTIEISDAMGHMRTVSNGAKDKKMVIFVPVKCEKWMYAGKIDTVVEKMKLAYRSLINQWVENPDVEMWCMPAITSGGIQFYKLLPGCKVFRTAEQKIGEKCSKDPITGTIYLPDGQTLSPKRIDRLETDMSQEVDHTFIPLSWYETNGKVFSPQFSEQPVYHLIRFLVKKEVGLANLKLNNLNAWQRFKQFFGWTPPFGKNLPAFTNLINTLSARGLIKENGDGYHRITETIE